MSDRDAILSALQEHAGGQAPAPYGRNRKPANDLWLEFEERLVGLGGQMLPLGALSLLLNRGGSCWVDSDASEFLPDGLNRATSVWDAEFGVCIADLAISETGSIVIAAGPGRSRLTSLAPPVNLLLIRDEAIVSTPEEAFSRLTAATTVLISGTSRTGDIEGVLVRGVHGPRELYVVKISSSQSGD